VLAPSSLLLLRLLHRHSQNRHATGFRRVDLFGQDGVLIGQFTPSPRELGTGHRSGQFSATLHFGSVVLGVVTHAWQSHDEADSFLPNSK